MNDVTISNAMADAAGRREHDAGEEQEFPWPDLSFGQPGPSPWLTPPMWDGPAPLAVRRPELLDDGESDGEFARWWHDVRSWAVWMVRTFHLSRTFPPCWPQHPALFEEMAALWVFWQDGLIGVDASRPVQFLDQLARSIDRCQRYWKVPCDPQTHKPATDLPVGADGHPDLHRWWGNDNYRTDWRIR